MKSTAIVLAAALAAVPVLSAGGDEKKPSPTRRKVFTEDDLRSAGRPKGTVSQLESASEPEPAASPSPDASPAPAAVPSPEPTEEEKRAASAKEFQRHIDHYAKEIATRRTSLDQAQRELNDLTDYSYGGRRKTVMEQMAIWESEIKEAEQKIADIEEQARRLGVRVSRP